MEAPYLNISDLQRENTPSSTSPRGQAPHHTHDPREYAAVAVWWADKQDPSLLACNDKIVVFDNAMTAKDFMPLLGGGRIVSWYEDGETCAFTPIATDGINRAAVVTQYDVYNLPPGLPVLSETRLREWRGHVMWSEMIRDQFGVQ